MTIATTYHPLSVMFERGEGIWLWDKAGNRYLDALSGVAVCSLGHCHPAVTQAITEQASKLVHTSNVYQIEQQIALAEKLTALTQMEQAFFANSGAEANETALKLTRLFAHTRGITDPAIIVMENAFHGRTLATLSASNRRTQAGFEPLVPGFVRVPFNDVPAIQAAAKNNPNIVAVLVEPIQGEGGIHIPASDYLDQIRALCDQHNWLFILDEIQTGLGRTGKLYAYQHSSSIPDVLTTAKALGNGVPIGACLMRGKAANLFTPGSHGATFGGNPLVCATALAVLGVLEEYRLWEQAATLGDYLLAELKEVLAQHPLVTDIRGQGLMLGIEMTKPCREIMTIGLKHHLLFNVTAERVIRLLPPLIIEPADADLIVNRLVACIEEYAANF